MIYKQAFRNIWSFVSQQSVDVLPAMCLSDTCERYQVRDFASPRGNTRSCADGNRAIKRRSGFHEEELNMYKGARNKPKWNTFSRLYLHVLCVGPKTELWAVHTRSVLTYYFRSSQYLHETQLRRYMRCCTLLNTAFNGTPHFVEVCFLLLRPFHPFWRSFDLNTFTYHHESVS